MPKYRISHTNYKNWQIDEWIVPGEDAKKEPHWAVYKYPGTLLQAVRGLLSLEVSNSTFESVEAVRTAILQAEQRILERAEEIFQSRD